MAIPAVDLREVAAHEAGHAVAGVLFAHPIAEVSIRPDRSRQRAGFVESIGAGVLEDRCDDDQLVMELLRQIVLSLYAGFAAQQVVNPAADVEGSRSDAEHVRELVDRYCLVRPSERWMSSQRRRAKALILGNWDAVDAVARALLRRKTLTHAALHSLVAAHVDHVPETIDYFSLKGQLLDVCSVTARFGFSAARLRRWNDEQRGPKAYRIGRLVRYHVYYEESDSSSTPTFERWS